MSSRSVLWLGSLLLLAPGVAAADGFAVDKVYHPYVQPLERELEYRVSVIDDSDDAIDGTQVHKLALGRSFSDRWFGEFYLIGLHDPAGSFSLKAYEAELKWQLTEQGEYAADWGLLFELETDREQDLWEYSTALLVEKEWGQWVGTLNVSAVYEWGSDIPNEWESELATQLRYRLSQKFEPAVELYSSELAKGIGPVALGTVPLSGPRKLRWEGGLIFGLDRDSPDMTARLMLEYEF